MARNSSTTLTKFVSATTVITADVANMWYGGLFGAPEGAACAVDDPLVAGHIHDGAHQDGHAQKINLVNHVTGQLRNTNLADDAVIKRNVQSFLDINSAIPEFEGGNFGDPGTTYYLDLTALRATIANNGAFSTTTNVTSNTPGALDLDDFVFGSDSLDDDGLAIHDNRMLFDKSKGAIRAGTANSITWDDANRGFQSVAFGRNTAASGARSTVAGGDINATSASAVQSFIGSGSLNAITGTESAIVCGSAHLVASDRSFVGGGTNNDITSGSDNSSVVGGQNNNITSTGATHSAILGGQTNDISGSGATHSLILGGQANTISSAAGTHSIIVGGEDNSIGGTTGDHSFIGAGQFNSNSGDFSFIGAGGGASVFAGNTIADGVSTAAIVSGAQNEIIGGLLGTSAFIGAGENNSIDNGTSSGIVAGSSHNLEGTECFIGAGFDNRIVATGAATSSDLTGCAIVAGSQSRITSTNGDNTFYNFIGAGSLHNISSGNTGTQTAIGSAIVSGTTNTIEDADYSAILCGEDNIIKTSSSEKLDYSAIWGGQGNEIEDEAIGGKAHGFFARASGYNQHAHGGGEFDGANPVKGQAQTSVFVAWDTISSTGSPVSLNLDGINKAIELTPNHGAVCKATWVARTNDGGGTELTIGGEIFGVFDNNAGTVSVVAQSTVVAHTPDGTLTATPSFGTGTGTQVVFRLTVSGGAPTPVRAVARLELTEVLYGP
jgi:hypothetical protein